MGNTGKRLVESRSFQLIADGNSARFTKQPATQRCSVWILSQPVSKLLECHSVFTSLQHCNIYFMKIYKHLRAYKLLLGLNLGNSISVIRAICTRIQTIQINCDQSSTNEYLDKRILLFYNTEQNILYCHNLIFLQSELDPITQRLVTLSANTQKL